MKQRREGKDACIVSEGKDAVLARNKDDGSVLAIVILKGFRN